jgi:hypothetical protein
MASVEAILVRDVGIDQSFSVLDLMVRPKVNPNNKPELVIIDFAFAEIFLKKCDAHIEEEDTKEEHEYDSIKGNRTIFRNFARWSFESALWRGREVTF